MEYTQLGRTGLKVSRLCLGTMNFGPQTAEKDSFAIMDKALDLGINFFDTANVYGWKLGQGVTEQIVGRWFALGGGRREKTVIATKVFGRMGNGPTNRESPPWAFASRSRDLSSVCRPITLTCIRCITLTAMRPGMKSGRRWRLWFSRERSCMQARPILRDGISRKRMKSAKARHFLGLVSEQSLYNLKDRMVELEVVPACREYGLGLIPWSPLAGGLLGGALQKVKEGRRAEKDRQNDIKKYRPQLVAWEKFCKQMGDKACRRGAGMAIGEPGCDRADYRSAHDGAVDG